MKKIFLPLFLFVFLLSSVSVTAMEVPVIPSTSAHSGDPVLGNPGIESALKDFKSLSKHDRKLRIKEAKKSLKEFKEAKKSGNAPSTNTLLLVILAILLPPLAVYLHEGEINNKFWIDLVLTLLFFLPGIIYALVVVLGKG